MIIKDDTRFVNVLISEMLQNSEKLRNMCSINLMNSLVEEILTQRAWAIRNATTLKFQVGKCIM